MTYLAPEASITAQKADKEKEKASSALPSESGQLTPGKFSTLPGHNNTQSKENPFCTAGMIAQREFTYRVIDWGLNSTIGVGFTCWTNRTESGKRIFGEPVNRFFTKVVGSFTKNPKSIELGAKYGAMFASIMAGGTAIIPFMIAAEKPENKEYVIRQFDKSWYGEQKVKQDPRFEACYKAIYDEPKKDFVTGMGARFLAIAPLITAVSIPKINAPLVKYLYTPIGHVSEKIATSVGIKPKGWMLRGQEEFLHGNPNNPKIFQSNWDFMKETIGFDFGLTFFYSILHEAAYKGLAELRNGESKNTAPQAPVPAVSYAASGVPPQTEKSFTQQFVSPGLIPERRQKPEKFQNFSEMVSRPLQPRELS